MQTRSCFDPLPLICRNVLVSILFLSSLWMQTRFWCIYGCTHVFGVCIDLDTFLVYGWMYTPFWCIYGCKARFWCIYGCRHVLVVCRYFLVVYGYPHTCWYLCRNTHRNTSIHMLVLSCCTFLLYIFGCRNVLVQILSLFYMDIDAFIFRYFFGYINVCERDTFLIRCVSC